MGGAEVAFVEWASAHVFKQPVSTIDAETWAEAHPPPYGLWQPTVWPSEVMWSFFKNFIRRRRAHRGAVVLYVDNVGVTIEHLRPQARHAFRWADVDAIETFKRDLLTTDDIRLVFLVGERFYEISEDFDGFKPLVAAMEKRFPTIPQDWFSTVMFPAFATNQRTLWRRESNDTLS